MKTVFIINPCAGQGARITSLMTKINTLSDYDKEIYVTKEAGDATRFVKSYCEKKGVARFIACGGDGTLNEVLNGAIGFKNAEVGVIPVGTGNDFCRNFDENDAFSDVLSQILGKTIKCDAIKYETETENGKAVGYCANMFNIGFDANVADMTNVMKRKPLISGSMAYFISIFIMLIKKKGANLKVEIDGKMKHFGKLLLTSVANGSYCGGGIKSNPLAAVTDGRISINIIKNVSRLHLLYLLPHYMKGDFLKMKNIKKVILSEKCSKVQITPTGENIKLCIDGEITTAGKTTFEICPKAFNFVVPAQKQI